MRFFLIAAVVLFVLALICLIPPISLVLGAGYALWTVAGLLALALDGLLGGYIVTQFRSRGQVPPT